MLLDHGRALGVSDGGFEALSLYGDGMGLFGFAGSNPVARCDALGLAHDDPFDAVNEVAVPGLLF